MLEPMTVRVEVWPVAADEIGLWLVSGNDAWRSAAIMADSDVHAEVELLLWRHNAERADVGMLHSTSWRAEETSVILTYMAVVEPGDLTCGKWPDAKPITLDLAETVGKPPTHAPTEPPTPRYVDVLMHGLRHLRFLLDNDATNASAMSKVWRRHLAPLEPALAGMYDEQHQTVG